MVSLADIQATLTTSERSDMEYVCLADLNLYQSPSSDSLVTQAALGRHLRVMAEIEPTDTPEWQKHLQAVRVCLCEDDYPGWLRVADLAHLRVADSLYQAIALSRVEIASRLPDVIAFTHAAMAQPNEYLWGGTVKPNFDCSGLMQAAFASVGIWLPRDAYQQEAFTQAIALADLAPGDLVFFGTPVKATHVGLYLGDALYIHSSGKDQGRNGIGIDRLSELGDRVSQTYYQQLRGAGRVMATYQPVP